MTLRRKTLIITGVTFVGLIVVLSAAACFLVFRTANSLEVQDTQQDMERVLSALQDDLATLNGTNEDWAFWDDTYAFINDRNVAYLRSNLTSDSPMTSNRLSLMVFVDSSGAVIYSRAYDYRKGEAMPLPASLGEHLSPGSPLLSHTRDTSGVTGILSLPEGALLIASNPILTSANRGPVRGTLIFGRYLDTTEIQRLSKTTLYSLTAYQADAPTMPLDFRQALSHLSEESPVLVRPLDDKSIAGYGLMNDIYGKPALVLKADRPRDIYAQSTMTVLYFVMSLFAFGIVFCFVTMVLLEKWVLSRLASLSLAVSNIGESNLSERVPVAGSDELSSLAASINGMLETVERSQHRLWESEKRFRSIFENAFDPMVILDDQGRIVEANPATYRLLGLEKDELEGKTINDLIQPERITEGLRTWQTLMEQGELSGESRIAGKSGQMREIEYYIKANFLPGYHLTAARDVTERKTLEKQLEHQAFHDPLTNLPNRALFVDRLAHALDRTARSKAWVAVLFLDLDDFKVINDTLGHRVGDQLLIEASERLQKCLRRGDTVARFGGDEFTVLMEDVQDEGEVIGAAERIADRLRAPFYLEGTEIVITASTGIAMSFSSHDQIDNLLRDADVAMYEAKRNGKARYALFDPGMNSRVWERLETEIELRRAIERQEFSVYYQPVVHLETGRVLEVEALVRWHHPQKGVILPGQFISLAEETGLILPIGQWVLNEACHQVSAWQLHAPDDPPLTLSVNLSARQFQQPTLVRDITRALGQAGLEPHCLKLEITESVALDHTGATADTLKELKALGIRLAIDDFGTGYSALSYLKRYPVDTLKIDRTFIRGLGSQPEDTAIVHAVIAFAKTLGMHVTAEGIETFEQLSQLRALGCDWGQGFYFADPLPAEALTEIFLTALGSEREGEFVTDVLSG